MPAKIYTRDSSVGFINKRGCIFIFLFEKFNETSLGNSFFFFCCGRGQLAKNQHAYIEQKRQAICGFSGSHSLHHHHDYVHFVIPYIYILHIFISITYLAFVRAVRNFPSIRTADSIEFSKWKNIRSAF